MIVISSVKTSLSRTKIKWTAEINGFGRSHPSLKSAPSSAAFVAGLEATSIWFKRFGCINSFIRSKEFIIIA